MDWGIGPSKMNEEAELEEGEAYDDDTSIDPDIALSYLDEKVQNVLGHFQKDFEGGFSAENLGAKFGGYGSFLPTYQRSPSMWSQPKTPQRVQTHTTTRSPMHREVVGKNAASLPDAPLSQRNGTAVTAGVHLSHEKMVQSKDGSERQDSCPSSGQGTEKFLAKHQPSPKKSFNPNDQKALKFRIKVGSDKMAQKNAAIYSGLGLTSPSSSTGNSPGESGGNLFQSQETPDESLSFILQMLTSVTIARDLLVSPLNNNFINLITNTPIESKDPEATVKLKRNHSTTSADDSTFRLRGEGIPARKLTEDIGKCEKYKEPRCGNRMVLEDDMLSRLKDNAAAEMLQSKDSFRDSAKAPQPFREHENGMILTKREASTNKAKGRLLITELVKDESFESMFGPSGTEFEHREAKGCSAKLSTKNQIKTSQKDVPVDHSEGARNKANKIPASLKADSDFSEFERDSKGDIDYLTEKASTRDTFHDQNELRMPVSAKKMSSKSKKKSKGGEVKGKQFVESTEESQRSSFSSITKQKGIKRDTSKVREIYKDLFETNSEPRSKPVDVLENSSSNRSKESNFETVKIKQTHADKLNGKPSCNKIDNQVTSGMLLEEHPTTSLPVNDGLTLVTEQGTVAPVLIEENWVCCDQCQTWRLLPYGTKPEDLPEKWLCSMLNWLPGMNRCDISEEETTKALYALYQLPLPENQHGIQNHADRPATGVHSVDEHLLNQNQQNVGFDYKANGRTKTHKIKETSFTGSKGKNLQQDLVKRGSSKDARQPLLGVKPVDRSINKSVISMKKLSNRLKQDHITGGDVIPKGKSKRESDQYEREGAKKSKTKGALDMNNFQDSAVNPGLVGSSSNTILPRMASMRDKEKHGDCDYSKDVKSEERNGLQTSVTKPSAGASGLLGNTSVDMMSKSNNGDISFKKRKLKDWQNSQSYAETLQNDGCQLQNRKLPVKEESSDSGFTRDKKHRVLQTDEKESSRSKSSDEQKRKDMKTRMLPSACDNRMDRNFDKPKQLKKYRVKFPSKLTMEDLESLKKDLGCEAVSTAATSSSSKVSDSRKNGANHLEVKGSPVESVSSSPMRMSRLNKLSPDDLGLDDVKAGNFPMKGRTEIFLERDVNYVDNKSGTAKKRKNTDITKPESAENHMLEFGETDPRDKLSGECKRSVRPSPFGNGHLDNNHLDTLEGNSTCLTDMRASEPCYNNDRIGENQNTTILLQKKSGKASSLLPNDKGRSSDLNSEGAVGKVSNLSNDWGVLKPKTSSRGDTDIDQNHVAAGVSLNTVKRPLVDPPRIKSVKTKKCVSERESRKLPDDSRENLVQPEGHRKSGLKLGDSCSKDANYRIKNFNTGKNVSAVQVCNDGMTLVDCHSEVEHKVLHSASKWAPRTQNGNLLHVRTHDVSISSDASKLSKDHQNVIHQNEPRHTTGNPTLDRSGVQDLSGPSPARTDASGQTAPIALKEAEDLRNYADNLKNSGFSFECNEVYFQAALKFLHAASLLESNSENSKSGEMNQMQIYSNTAKLCETCAHEYERRQEMAAAAMAYKCMEVAHMRVIYCKTTSTNRLCHDLRESLQIVSQGESPSSSASDIDNLNNQVLVEKASLSKSNGSHSGSHVIARQNRPSFVRLLDFTKDVNSAMEASRKSQNAFSAANIILEESQNKEGIVAIKSVIDFSFQDVEEFVRLVRIAIEAISRQGFIGSRD